MCVEEEGGGKALGGGVSSIIHQLMDQPAPLIYLILQGAERLLLLAGSRCSHFRPSLSCPSILSLFWGWMNASAQPGCQYIDHGCPGRADCWAVLWAVPLGGSTLDPSSRAGLIGWSSQKVFLLVFIWKTSFFSLHCIICAQDTYFFLLQSFLFCCWKYKIPHSYFVWNLILLAS